MRWRLIALVSLGLNLGLAAAWLVYSRHTPPKAPASGITPSQAAGAVPSRTNFLIRRQFFSWQQVESPDYPTYIQNLRDIGCPEQTIRDIIIADVNALFSRRRATELVTPDQQWWRSQPDAAVALAASEKARALDLERQTLLASLLGPNWESGDLLSLPRPTHPGLVLDGPILGLLSPEIKQSLQDISSSSQEKLQAYLDSRESEGKDPEPSALAKLRQGTREQLARVLAPPQLEEYLLRYSQYASNLRNKFGDLKFFNPSADEFRAVFRATDDLDQRIELLADATDANSVAGRKALEAQRENALKLALGAKRYEEYRMLQDPLYRDAVAAAQAAGTPEAARTIYQINLAAKQQQQSITADATLTEEQRKIALKNLELEQMQASAIASGEELPPQPPTPPQPPPKRTYTLRQGDSISVVAAIYGVPESAIRSANPGVNFTRVKPGTTINIPRDALSPDLPINLR